MQTLRHFWQERQTAKTCLKRISGDTKQNYWVKAEGVGTGNWQLATTTAYGVTATATASLRDMSKRRSRCTSGHSKLRLWSCPCVALRQAVFELCRTGAVDVLIRNNSKGLTARRVAGPGSSPRRRRRLSAIAGVRPLWAGLRVSACGRPAAPTIEARRRGGE
jgi:hypothetical protein